MVSLSLSFDKGAFGQNQTTELAGSCLRSADPATWRNSFTFGRVCAARTDYVDLPHDLPPHPWDFWLPDDLKYVKTQGRSWTGSEL